MVEKSFLIATAYHELDLARLGEIVLNGVDIFVGGQFGVQTEILLAFRLV